MEVGSDQPKTCGTASKRIDLRNSEQRYRRQTNKLNNYIISIIYFVSLYVDRTKKERKKTIHLVEFGLVCLIEFGLVIPQTNKQIKLLINFNYLICEFVC